jgi:hypothetical protein
MEEETMDIPDLPSIMEYNPPTIPVLLPPPLQPHLSIFVLP